MRGATRWLVACVLAVAVPMKAMAMVLGAACLPLHGVVLPAHASGHHPHHNADPGAPHPHAAQHDSHAADGLDRIDGPDRSDAKPAAMKCSACAPCCAAIVGPVAALWQPPTAGHTLASAEFAPRLGVVPRLAHPPPRAG